MKLLDVELLRKHGFVLAKVKTDKNGEVTEFMTVQLDDAPAADLAQIKKEWAREIFSELEAMTEIHEFHDVEFGNWTEQYVELSIEDIADLKKKYEVDV